MKSIFSFCLISSLLFHIYLKSKKITWVLAFLIKIFQTQASPTWPVYRTAATKERVNPNTKRMQSTSVVGSDKSVVAPSCLRDLPPMLFSPSLT